MKKYTDKAVDAAAKSTLSALFMAVVLVSVLVAPSALMAQEFGGADERVNTFFTNINGLLNIASIAVVTIAVIFAGYQIAFAHKRMADVAPVLIGGFLIGAAAQIARMLLGPEGGAPAAMVLDLLPKLYA